MYFGWGQIIVKQSGGAGALIADCANSTYVAGIADCIIEGTVEKVESRWNDEKTSIFTYATLSIEKYVKGTTLKADTLQIVTSGGTVGGITQVTEDQPIFHEGRKVRIYFEETNGNIQ